MTDQPTPQAPTFTEAPASLNVKFIWNKYDFMLTLRDTNTVELLKRAHGVMDWFEQVGAEPTRVSAAPFSQPAAPPPPPVADGPQLVPAGAEFDAEDHSDEVIEIKTLSHSVTENGKPFIKVKGGKYSKYGIKAWPDNLPAALQNFGSWEVGREFVPPAGVKHAVVRDGKKVIEFKP